MGLLGDIFSTIDSKKRQLKGLLDAPGATIDKAVGQLRDDYRNMVDTQATAYPWTSAKQQSSTPQQVAAAQQQLADMGANMGMAAATVWHGSPHKFDKFDSSKIGSGEGAQAYGHGLYLAESPDVAKQYRDMLSSSEYRLKGGGQYDPANPTHIAAAVLDEYGGDASKAIKGLTEKINQNKQVRGGEQWNKDLLQQLNTIKAGKAAQIETVTDGSLYKVDLPDEHIAKMLDWDKPLNEQTAQIQEYAKLQLASEIKGAKSVADGWGDLSQPYDVLSEMTGKDLVSKLRPNLNLSLQNITGGGGPEASNALRQAGIPGIRYLDGGSRGAGKGSSNFVVFPGNESMLSILERNGQPVGGLLK